LSVSQRHKNSTDIIFHFNPRFQEAVIVRNSMLRGEWGGEEREGQMVFKQGAEFTIDICCQDEGFKVCDILIIVVAVIVIVIIIKLYSLKCP